MTIEEKAKAYDEALEIARKIHDQILNSKLLGFPEQIREIFPELKESEDERITRAINNMLPFIPDEAYTNNGVTKEGVLNWLEKQKEKGSNITANLLENSITGIQRELIEFLANNIDNSWVDIVKSADAYTQRIRAMVEKQKDASKAIEAVDRIDKYIDEHLTNAHDMKDSNPDKKYYRGWDDALGKMAGILQDVYSGEKQKESLHISETCKENPDSFTDEDEKIRKALVNIVKGACGKYGIKCRVDKITEEKLFSYLEKQKDLDKMIVVSPEVWDKAINDAYENGKKDNEKQKEQKPISTVEVLARAGLKPYKDGNQWCILAGDNIQEGICGFGDTIDEALYEFLKEVLIMANSPQLKEQKPTDYPYLPGWRKNCDDNKPELKRSVLMLTTHGVAEGEWLGEKWCQYRWSCELKDGEVLYWMHMSDLERLEKEGEGFSLQPKQEWSDEDEKTIRDAINRIERLDHYWNRPTDEKLIKRLKSLRPSWKPSKEQTTNLLRAEARLRIEGESVLASKLAELYEQLKSIY